jgi:hypothetical protein
LVLQEPFFQPPQLLNDGQNECKGLSTARACVNSDVFESTKKGNDSLLDRCGMDKAELRQDGE